MASFCGGAVGVLSTLLVVEVNNKDRQAAQRCVYCEVSLVASKYPNSAVTLACQLLLCPDTPSVESVKRGGLFTISGFFAHNLCNRDSIVVQ